VANAQNRSQETQSHTRSPLSRQPHKLPRNANRRHLVGVPRHQRRSRPNLMSRAPPRRRPQREPQVATKHRASYTKQHAKPVNNTTTCNPLVAHSWSGLACAKFQTRVREVPNNQCIIGGLAGCRQSSRGLGIQRVSAAAGLPRRSPNSGSTFALKAVC
jgi:hypothetical protein